MLKIFGQFEDIILEMVGGNNKSRQVRKYASITGQKCCDSERAFQDREGKNWQNVYRIHFNAPDKVIESLRKLGCNVRENKIPKSITKHYGSDAEYRYTFSNDYWFWKLVEYGYRLGTNINIPYSLYKLRKHLREMRKKDLFLFDIVAKESEDPETEAKLLVA